ncbi:MAG TPA: MerR family transcriptional regulator [Actinocrinis sp.]|nr:MerR family transcriptional regulator [Actinocrinis sp.]
MDTETWTLDELARRAGQALAADSVRAPNGRVRERPDGRSIRWYATIGLVDRPVAGPGRTALYGPRHLVQLVAVKRLQAQGFSLAEIQAELAGAAEAKLRRIADLPPDGELSLPMPLPAPVTRARPGAIPTAPAEPAAPTGGNTAPPARFWATRPARATGAPTEGPTAESPAAPEAVPASASGSAGAEAALAVASAPDPTPTLDSGPLSVRYEIALSDIVTLTVPSHPTADDLAAIREAAAGLLDLLAARGLTTALGVHDENQHHAD